MKRVSLTFVALAFAWTTSAAAQPWPAAPPDPAGVPEAVDRAEPLGQPPPAPSSTPPPLPPEQPAAPAPTAAPPDRWQEPPPRGPRRAGSRKNFRLRTGVNYAQTKLYTVPIRMGDFELHIGGPTRERTLIFYVSAHQAFGRTEQGLTVWNTSGGATLEMESQWVQVGLELRASMLIVGRKTRDGSMVSLALGGRPYLAVNLVPIDDESAVQLVLGLGVDAFGGDDPTTNVTPGLGLGFRY